MSRVPFIENRSPYPKLPATTLIIGGWSSSCNNCGRQVLPESKSHDEVSGMYERPWDKGCGITFTHVTAEYGEHHEKFSKELRPDLEYVGITEGF